MNCRVFLASVLVLILLQACATQPVSKVAEVRDEILSKGSDPSICGRVLALSLAIMTIRQVPGGNRQQLTDIMLDRYPGFDVTIAAMVEDAYRHSPKSSIYGLSAAAVDFKNKWINAIGVCPNSPD